MSGKTSRQVRKGINALKKDKEEMSNELITELLNAPFSFRLRFALQLIFWRKKK